MSANLALEAYYGQNPVFSNSTILESDKSCLLIDSQLLSVDGKAIADRIKEIGKPLTTILLSHWHPDHCWGAVEVLKHFPEAKVFARPRVKEDLLYDFAPRRYRWYGYFPGMPDSLYPVNDLEGDAFDFDGHKIELVDLFGAETLHATGYYVPELKTYISGDQIYNGGHYYVTAGLNRPDLWIDSIKKVTDEHDIERLVPGHGLVTMNPGEVFNSAIEYLNYYQEIFNFELPPKELVRLLLERYPDLGMDGVLYLTIGPAITDKELYAQTGGKPNFGEGAFGPGADSGGKSCSKSHYRVEG
ncbi:MAG: MBL fold metallo-hydrolase [Rhodothermales bacterium]|nr:MBL fold metallo-hydrolase [Rhodothermales bacterium]